MSENRLAVFAGPRRIELRSEPMPVLAPGEALVRLRACGLCTMERRLWSGLQNDYPIAPGHEAAGLVEAVHPEGVHEIKGGEQVVIAFLDRCMQCFYCRRGDTHLCTGKLQARIAGCLRRIGGLADYAAVPASKLFILPRTLPYDEMALAEPLACVIHSVHKAEPRLGDDVLVVGAGTMGQLHLLVAKLRGARVFVSDPSPAKLRVALAQGAKGAFDPEDAVTGIRHHTGGRGADVVFVTFGSAEAAKQAAGAVRRGGRIVYYASFASDAEAGIEPHRLHLEETRLEGARSQTMRDWTEATRLLANGIIRAGFLVSARYPLERLEEALERALEPDSYRVMVTSQEDP